MLVSNQHLLDVDSNNLSAAFQQCPIVCRLTDFGLSRSVDTQTQTVPTLKTKSISCGTPAYMAPEMFLNELESATQIDLKRADMWSMGLVAHTMMNPELGSPYRAEMEESGVTNPDIALKDLLVKRQLPKHGSKYEKLRVTSWWQLEDIFNLCARFNSIDRLSAEQMLCFHQNSLTNSFQVFPMSVSQSSALDKHDGDVAADVQESLLAQSNRKCNLYPRQPTTGRIPVRSSPFPFAIGCFKMAYFMKNLNGNMCAKILRKSYVCSR